MCLRSAELHRRGPLPAVGHGRIVHGRFAVRERDLLGQPQNMPGLSSARVQLLLELRLLQPGLRPLRRPRRVSVQRLQLRPPKASRTVIRRVWRGRDRNRTVIKLDTATNGEYVPPPASPALARARRLAADGARENARRLGLGRREFLATASGAATGLLALNRAFAADSGRPPGGAFQVPPGAALDVDQALSVLGGREFIFDVQTHYVNPSGPWRKHPFSSWNIALRVFPQARCDEGLMARV